MAKRKRWRYTEYVVDTEPKGLTGWMKLLLSYIVISPLRLVNEISQKALFLGRESLQKVCLHASIINATMLAWAIFWQWLKPDSKPYIPFAVNILSFVLTVVVHIRLGTVKDFEYEIVEGADEEEEEALLAFDPDAIVAFDKMQAADVSFNDAINVFLNDPSELVDLGVSPAVYQEAEEVRLLNAISQKTEIFPTEQIEIADIFNEPPLGTQLEENFKSLMGELEIQISI